MPTRTRALGLIRTIQYMFSNNATKIFFAEEGKNNSVHLIPGDAWVFSFRIPEEGLRIEDSGKISSAFWGLIRDQREFLFACILDQSRLVEVWIILPVTKNPPPSYITEYGFSLISCDQFNQRLMEIYGITPSSILVQI
jgi:hypothetical protein